MNAAGYFLFVCLILILLFLCSCNGMAPICLSKFKIHALELAFSVKRESNPDLDCIHVVVFSNSS